MPLSGGASDSFASTQIDALKKSFPGEIIGVAGRGVEAKMFLGAGWKSYLIGQGSDVPQGATTLADWAELPKKVGQ
jgi:hypothetical protein